MFSKSLVADKLAIRMCHLIRISQKRDRKFAFVSLKNGIHQNSGAMFLEFSLP